MSSAYTGTGASTPADKASVSNIAVNFFFVIILLFGYILNGAIILHNPSVFSILNISEFNHNRKKVLT